MYCINDPVRLGDPSGNDLKTVVGAITGFVAGAGAAYQTATTSAENMGANKFQAAAAGATAGYYEGIKSGLNYTERIDNSNRDDWKTYRIGYEAELEVKALRENGN